MKNHETMKAAARGALADKRTDAEVAVDVAVGKVANAITRKRVNPYSVLVGESPLGLMHHLDGPGGSLGSFGGGSDSGKARADEACRLLNAGYWAGFDAARRQASGGRVRFVKCGRVSGRIVVQLSSAETGGGCRLFVEMDQSAAAKLAQQINLLSCGESVDVHVDCGEFEGGAA